MLAQHTDCSPLLYLQRRDNAWISNRSCSCTNYLSTIYHFRPYCRITGTEMETPGISKSVVTLARSSVSQEPAELSESNQCFST